MTDGLLELPHPSFRDHRIISSVYFANLPELSACIAGDPHSKIASEGHLKEMSMWDIITKGVIILLCGRIEALAPLHPGQLGRK